MPNCFTLTKIGETKPTNLQTIDEEICAHFGEPVDSEYWFCSWYDVIGLSLACGKTFDWIIDEPGYSPKTIAIARFLRDNYTSDAWCER